jgi:hypothetical protein
MSKLEDEAKPILAPMMNPKRVARAVKLSRAHQRVAACWAFEKALCLELSMRQTQRGYRQGHLSKDIFHWLYDHRATRTLPPGAQIWMFAFNAQELGEVEARMAFHGSITVTNKAVDPQTPVGFLATMTIGTLGLQVFGHDITYEGGVPREPEPLVMPSWLSPVLIPIWPTLNPVARWLGNGPRGVVGAAGLGRLTTWGDLLAPPE